MKRLISTMLMLSLVLCLSSPLTAYAVGDGNIDSGGGGMGDGSSSSFWSPGNEGVRVTVIRASDHAQVTTPFDFSSTPPSASIYHFGKVSKLQYNNGVRLTPVNGGYLCVKPAQAMPRIISTSGNNNIEAIKTYFCSEYVIKRIADITGMDYDVLIGGQYKLLLEPFAFYKFEDDMFATTATEAALYDEQTSGLLRTRMMTLTHKNLPLAMFLEVGDLGYPAWGGSTTSAATNADIKSSLGLGIVRFTEQPELPSVDAYDYEYRINTEVITAVRVSGGQSNPDNPTSVSFHIGGQTINVGNIYYPSGDSQLAWIRWTTPDTAQEMVIHVSVNGPGGTNRTTLNAKIVDLDKNPPPNPVADDRNDSFRTAPAPDRTVTSRADWSVWRPWWSPHWVWHSGSVAGGFWCDHGVWVFDLDRFNASLSATMRVKPDSNSPTASGKVMKSGYGLNQTVESHVSSNQSAAVTQPQNAVSYFPEFRYETFWRLLERMGGGQFEFQKNKYSTYKNRTHFTPIWMPNGDYPVNTWLIDAWTPEGMLSANLTDNLTIRGSLWDDWHVGPLKPT